MKRTLIATFAFFTAAGAGAQEKAIDLHADYSRGTQSHLNSWGAGAALQLTWVENPIKINTSPGIDYMKQQSGGPGTVSTGLDLSVQPGGSSAITPYLGGSVSENWSTGDAKQWTGAKYGLEALGGIQYKPSPSASTSFKIEERYGYIDEQEHTLATRAGVLISF